jgi:hypothetical protein
MPKLCDLDCLPTTILRERVCGLFAEAAITIIVAENFPDRPRKFPVLCQKFPASLSRESGINVRK